jgi:hypothetical protein
MLDTKLKTETQTIIYHIILDTSKSMQVHQPELYTMLIKHLQNLNKSMLAQGKLIHISCSYFNSENLGFEESCLSTIKLLKKTREKQLSGNTNIFDALAENLKYVSSKLDNAGITKPCKIYLALISDGHENKSSNTNPKELNKSLIKFRKKNQAEFIIISGVFHDIDCDIKLTIPAMGQYAKDPTAIQYALDNLHKYVCGYKL